VQLAKAHHAKVFSSTAESFAELRNEGLRKASGEWVLYVDADERVTEELKKEILTEIDSSFHDAYLLRRKNYYFHTVEWPYIEQMERLFRREKLTEWYGDLHESPRVDGTV